MLYVTQTSFIKPSKSVFTQLITTTPGDDTITYESKLTGHL